jgi:alpha-tubulin suppressor-like RCC1 family protein
MKRRRGRRVVAAALGALALLVVGAVGPAPAAVETPGTPYTWGSNPGGQLGDGTFDDRFSAAPVAGLDDVIDLTTGREHAVALRSNATVVAWGRNEFGQVGDGSIVPRSLPVEVNGLSNVTAVAGGHYHSMALRSNGTVATWGFNASGQLGDGTTTHRSTPVTVSGLTNVMAIAAGRNMSYALRNDGTVWAWGLNTSGQLGDGTTTSRTTPVRVGALDDITRISGGRDHGLAVHENGTVWSWGDNTYGQLGDDSVVDRTNPVTVEGISTAVEVAGGAHHSFARLENGTIAAWGRNYRGQLGDGTLQQRQTPVQVSGISNAIEVGTGRDHGMAVLANGSVRAWGWNDFGQVGDGTTTTRVTPVVVPGVSDAAIVHGGQNFSAALTSVETTDQPPSRPGRPVGSSTGAGTIDLAWDASSDDLSNTLTYRVFRSGVFVGTVVSASSNQVTYTDAPIAPGTAHTYVVVAVDGEGNTSSPSPVSDPIRELSPIFVDDFDGMLESWDKVVRLTVDPSTGGPTAPSARAEVVRERRGFARVTLTQPLGAACASAQVNLTSIGDKSVTLLRFRAGVRRSIASVNLDPSGRLVVRADVAAVRQNSQVRLGSGWHELEFCVAIDGGDLELTRDGEVISSWSADLGSAPIAVFELGNSARRLYHANFDTVVVDPVD